LRVRASIVAIAAVGWLVSATPTAEAVFPGSNGRIAFTRPDRILTMEPDGSDVVVIRRNAGEPAWNAAGTRIAFSGARRSGKTDIFVMAADGSEGRDLTRFRPGFNLAPAWSPDGRTIVFVHNDREGTDLYTVGRRGRNLTRLTTSPRIVERAPEWSPDGSRILFSRVRETGMPTDEDLFTIAPDGSDLTRLTRSRLHDFQGSWAPDGDRIVFVRETRRLGPKAFVMGADGSDATRLTSDAPNEFWPAFSPDGARISLSRCEELACDLYVIDPDGSNATPLTGSSPLDSRPDWQPL
jgi:TolB protein